MPRRVVITGLGAVTGFGYGVKPLWDALLAGRTCLAPLTAFDATPFRCHLAGEARDFSVKDHVPKSYRKAVKVMARDIELAVGAAKAAVEDAGLITKAMLPDPDADDAATRITYRPERVGCQIGAGLIAAEIPELSMALASSTDPANPARFSFEKWGAGGMDNLTPLWLLKYLPNMLACHVTILHDAQGPSNTITCAEASGLLSIGESMRVIERGDAELCFSGSAESKLNPMGFMRMEFAQRLAHTKPDADPASVVRPYDAMATGMVLGEGGGIVMLEELDAAAARGARPYAELVGFGAGHSPMIGTPAERADGLRAAIENALDDARITAADIDAILPHACGAAEEDLEELTALRAVFGPRLNAIPLITMTPNIGDTVGGNGGLAACVAAMTLRAATLPARIHAGRPSADLQAGACPSRPATLRHILVCTNALGGQNAALIMKAV